MTTIRTRGRGELEAEVMRILWEQVEPLSVMQIQVFVTGHVPAYTTLMTALDRLQKKGQVVRLGSSPRKVRFQAAQSSEEHASDAMMSVLEGAGDRHAALLRFAGNLTAEDADLLQQTITTGRNRNRKRR